MTWMVPLPVVVPLIGAAVIAAAGHFTPRLVHNLLAVAAMGTAFVFSVILMVQANAGQQLHWFGNWQPRDGVAIGIAFTVDPLGAGLAALASGLTLAALVYSLAFLEEASYPYHVLMTAFGGAMCGFALTGDIFNMFVWFELMGVAAYALAGFKVGELGTLQGAINFAVTNTIGAYFLLIGIGLLYARTGALNFAQIGRTLAGQEAGGVEIVALTLILVGFLVKAAIVPFHFWLADAHAVAPAPVCVLFSGAMVELGLLGVARTWFTIFDAPFGSQQIDVRNMLVALGLVTAVVGAVMAFGQSHVKRLLAYSTISHAGVILVGIGLLDSKSLAGAAGLVLSHGLLKGALFLAAGVLFVRCGGIDELRLYARGRGQWVLATLWFLGAIGLIGLPYVGSYIGHAQIDEGAKLQHMEWIAPVLMVTSGIASAAILRAGARIFLGWGAPDDELLTQQPPEEPAGTGGHTGAMLAITAVLIGLGLVVSVVPGLGQRAERGAEMFRDRAQYAKSVLHGASPKPRERPPFVVTPTGTGSVLYGLGAGALAVAFAAFGLWHRRVRWLERPFGALKVVHTGVVGDYVMWLTVGTALLGGIWAITLR